MERFISPYANQNITMTGRKESRRLPTTSRVRNLDPSTPRRRSANNFSRLRQSTKVSTTNNRNTINESATRNTVCWLVAGLMNGRSKDDSESKIPNKSRLPTVSRMMIFFRLGLGRIVFGETIPGNHAGSM